MSAPVTRRAWLAAARRSGVPPRSRPRSVARLGALPAAARHDHLRQLLLAGAEGRADGRRPDPRRHRRDDRLHPARRPGEDHREYNAAGSLSDSLGDPLRLGRDRRDVVDVLPTVGVDVQVSINLCRARPARRACFRFQDGGNVLSEATYRLDNVDLTTAGVLGR